MPSIGHLDKNLKDENETAMGTTVFGGEDLSYAGN
jgi:hypothetical protein